jgi:hypothetical protein
MDVYALRKCLRQRENKQHKTYDDLVDKCCRLVLRAAETKRSYYDFQVPMFVFGAPLYDIDRCVSYTMSKLHHMGYTVVRRDNNVLRVSWSAHANNAEDTNNIPISDRPVATRAPTSDLTGVPRSSALATGRVTRGIPWEPPPNRSMSCSKRSENSLGQQPYLKQPKQTGCFPPPNQWLSSRLIDAYRPKLPHKSESFRALQK